MIADILQLFDDALSKAIRDGRTFRQFAEEVTPEPIKKGWWGRKPMTDPKTGETLDGLQAKGVMPGSGAIVIRDSIVLHMICDAKRAPVPRDVLRRLPELLAAQRAILRDGDLIYVLDTNKDRPDKVVIRLDFVDKAQTDAGRRRFQSASIRTAGVVPEASLRDANIDEAIFGKR